MRLEHPEGVEGRILRSGAIMVKGREGRWYGKDMKWTEKGA